MKRGFKLHLLLLVCLLLCIQCACGSLEKKFTILETENETESKASLVSEQIALEQYWYGYWYISDTRDEWESLEGYSWDCCGELSEVGEGLSLLLWDEDMPKDYYLAKIDFSSSQGVYSCTGGEFLDIGLGGGEPHIKLRDKEGLLLEISGVYKDTTTGSFYYAIFLRPWGDRWPQGGSRPYYYEQWYLPKIEAGEEPPDVIDPYE